MLLIICLESPSFSITQNLPKSEEHRLSDGLVFFFSQLDIREIIVYCFFLTLESLSRNACLVVTTATNHWNFSLLLCPFSLRLVDILKVFVSEITLIANILIIACVY